MRYQILAKSFISLPGCPKKVNKSNKYSQKNGKPKKKKGKSLSVVRTKDVQTSFKNSGNKDKPIDPDNPFAKALMGFNRDK